MSTKRPLSQRLFDDNNAFFRIMGVAGDLMILNLLVILTSIPVITMGAALTAMNRVLLAMVRDEPIAIARDYFATLRRTWKPATLLWLIGLIIGIVAAVDFAAMRSSTMQALPSTVRIAAFVGIFAICIATAGILYWSLLILAQESIQQTAQATSYATTQESMSDPQIPSSSQIVASPHTIVDHHMSLSKRIGFASKVAFGFLPYTILILFVVVAFCALYAWLFLYAFIPIVLLGFTVPAGINTWIISGPLSRVQA